MGYILGKSLLASSASSIIVVIDFHFCLRKYSRHIFSLQVVPQREIFFQDNYLDGSAFIGKIYLIFLILK
ncbi:hypothetical protein BOV90_05575 [Solemya velum gill symbiont]|uniref:Uncharacterized protein n=1 Tax=Solemya velum gill symbiont TaxID=2340 RepID=A0A1T2CZ75_SOVGS|nr:hypothetical protein BOV88_07890 [Solemya velum gill symbiont]OOY37557.1 hypothetical protein BOV89_06725 [Solemya velum gill symbiont]OOY40179.1 hypothetical protein BOV90_05575 [Solemya velum gill symbiont]OOY46892.1 hypothetical protein BOV92_02395 [Solemya velum gill symbiont]OOY47815.1 hypothetical protein BOV93_05355 [Solemya velum gill symbiont]